MTWFKKAQNTNQTGHNEELWKSIQEASSQMSRKDYDNSSHALNDFFAKEYYKKQAYQKKFGYSIPSKKAVEKIAKWVEGGKIIEIAAGRGLWARLLSDIGVVVEASDYQAILKNNWLNEQESEDSTKNGDTFHPILEMLGEEHSKLGGAADTLMLVWPDFREQNNGNDWQSEAVKNFAGNKIILIGEQGGGGATGTPKFWEEIKNYWIEKDHVSIPNWTGIYDYVVLYLKT